MVDRFRGDSFFSNGGFGSFDHSRNGFGSGRKQAEAGQIREKAWNSFGGPAGIKVSDSDIDKLFKDLDRAERLSPSNDRDLIEQAAQKASRARIEILLKKGFSSHGISDAVEAHRYRRDAKEITEGKKERAVRAGRLARACDRAIDLVRAQLADTDDNRPLLDKIAQYQRDHGYSPTADVMRSFRRSRYL